ncbi:4063_t:CDS:2 [Racocetra persica]|uniref:4063_t:CDS:1 n=1 Tax=Racocetra persica TaxID=160502 RepID=A0ACA9KAG2_9GLOM|nr:4063_t:CDS:2 [Racocetra persica]
MIHSKKALFNMKLIPSHWYSEEGLKIFNKSQESSVLVVQNKNNPILTTIMTGSNNVLESILQRFIDEQISVQNKNTSEQELNQKNNSFSISNLCQHKDELLESG